MTDAKDAAVDRVEIRRTVRAFVDGQPVDKRETINEVAARTDANPEFIKKELAELERTGFIYTVGDGDAAEVRLP